MTTLNTASYASTNKTLAPFPNILNETQEQIRQKILWGAWGVVGAGDAEQKGEGQTD